MTHYIFIGGFYSPKMLVNIREESRGKIMFASHNFELSLIDGLSKQSNLCCSIISAPGVGSFPTNNKRLFTQREVYKQSGLDVISIGFCNLFVLNKINLIFNLVKELFKVSRSKEADKIEIIISTATVYLQIAYRIFKAFSPKTVKCTTIINDVPIILDNMNPQKSLKMRLRTLLDHYGMRLLNKCDRFVLMTEQTMDFIKGYKPHIVMEGIINVGRVKAFEDEDTANEVVLYAGSINKQYGILNLVDAFQMTKHKGLELWICGSGDAKQQIIEAASKDSRIKFYGLVDSDTALGLQRKASILVNPRTSDGDYTKYSFPSKTIEYMLSGKSVIINNLPCIPSEYLEYVYCPIDETTQSLAKCIDYVCDIPVIERKNKAVKSRDFIVTNKNSKFQVGRILDLIKNSR